MLIYQGQAKANPDGVESVTALLPTRAEAGAPCVVLWRNGSKIQATKKTAGNVETSKFGNFEAILEKDGNQNTKFKSVSSGLELEFSGGQKTLSLSFQPTHGGQILTVPMALTLGDLHKSTSPESEAYIFGGHVIVQNQFLGNLIAVVLCEKDGKGSQKPVLALIEWGSETAMAEIPLGVQTCQSQDANTIPGHDENICFGLNSRQHHFHGQLKRHRGSPSELLLHIRPLSTERAAAAWQTTQSYPAIRKYNKSMEAIVSRSKRSHPTKVWNDTGDDNNDIAPALVTVTIQQSGARIDNYNKGMAGAGLFVALLGVAACAAPPSLSSVGWAVGIVGLLLAGQSGHDNFHEDPDKSRTRVLYPRDAVSLAASGADSNEIVMHRAYMEGSRLKITEYIVPKVGPFLYRVTDIISGRALNEELTRTTKDLFTFTFPEPQVINIYRYISIRGFIPSPTKDKGSGLPTHGLPKAGSLVLYDADGKFLMFHDAKQEQGGKRADVVDRFGAGLFDPKGKVIRSDVTSLVQGVNPQLSSNMKIANLDDHHNTPVLVMNNWKVCAVGTGEFVAKADDEESVLKVIKGDRRRRFREYQWDSNGNIYRLEQGIYEASFLTQNNGTHLFFAISHHDWTYTSMVTKKA
ncbi:hypothetical protein ACHAQJ_000713 [Trichoderma viride]